MNVLVLSGRLFDCKGISLWLAKASFSVIFSQNPAVISTPGDDDNCSGGSHSPSSQFWTFIVFFSKKSRLPWMWQQVTFRTRFKSLSRYWGTSLFSGSIKCASVNFHRTEKQRLTLLRHYWINSKWKTSFCVQW